MTVGTIDDPARHRALLNRIAVAGITTSVLGALPAALITIVAVRPDVVSTGALLALQVLTGVLGGAGDAAVFGLLALRLQPHCFIRDREQCAFGGSGGQSGQTGARFSRNDAMPSRAPGLCDNAAITSTAIAYASASGRSSWA
jgi:hypothetical protein